MPQPSSDPATVDLPPLRRIAIIGAGAMGASLAALTSPHVPTTIVVRNPLLARQVRDHGILLTGELEGRGHPDVADSIDDLADIHPIDLVVIATKTTAIPEICDAMRPHLSVLPFLLSYQNGIEPARAIIATLGTSKVIRMVLHYGAAIVPNNDGPLTVRVSYHDSPHFVGGEGDEQLTFARALAGRLTAMGLPTQFESDIDIEVWRKGLMNAATNPVAALVRAPLDEMFASPARPLIERLLAEGIAVARAAGIALPDDVEDAALQRMRAGGGHLPSMVEDVIRGRSTEITQLNVQIAERGVTLGVPTPTHDTIIDLIRTFDWRVSNENR